MRVAIIHYWLVGMRGGEKVLEAILDLFPEADLYTHVYAPEAVSNRIRARGARTTFIQKLPFAAAHYQRYLPLMPLALEQLDLRGYDLVISSESGPAKGVLTGARTTHVCYCHTPMRYLWDFYQDYLEQCGPLKKIALRWLSHHLRLWDALSAQRVDYFAANSRNVALRIAKHYRRGAEVIHPPVDVESFAPANGVYPASEDFYLYAGQLTSYKRPDLAVAACKRLGRKLLVVGDGPDKKRLAATAGPTVSFLGRCGDVELASLMGRCRALLFPGEEDFGMVPVEAMAAGRPVIALGRGGAAESVLDGATGILFHEQNEESLCRAILDFERREECFTPAELTAQAGNFSRQVFDAAFSAFVERCLAQGGGSGHSATRTGIEP